jgi:hypothetical protein
LLSNPASILSAGERTMKRVFCGLFSIILLVGFWTLAFNVQPAKATGTIYIRADGSIDPQTVPIQRDGDIYNFTNNITGSIWVERSNIIVDGSGYVL